MPYKKREARLPITATVRFRTDHEWASALVRNVSSRGLMATCQPPPVRGAYLEIRRGAYVIVGRVVWSSGDRFGLKAQDTIAAEALTGAVARPRSGERRREPRAAVADRSPRPASREIADASVRFARAFDFAVVAAGVVAGALLLADTTSQALASPLQSVKQAMSAAPSSR